MDSESQCRSFSSMTNIADQHITANFASATPSWITKPCKPKLNGGFIYSDEDEALAQSPHRSLRSSPAYDKRTRDRLAQRAKRERTQTLIKSLENQKYQLREDYSQLQG